MRGEVCGSGDAQAYGAAVAEAAAEAARMSRVVRGRLKAGGSIGKCRGARERTKNMPPMSVTRDVSKLSGWLKADAEPNMAPMDVTLKVSKLSGWLKADAESNMEYMLVTRDVSKLSGWLKADADQNM